MKRLTSVDLNTPEYYQKYWSDPANARYDRVRLMVAIDKVKEGDKVLDVGAGVCSWVEYCALNNLRPGTELHAIDFSSRAKEQVDAKKLNLTYHVGSALQLPFPDKSFDVVGCMETIEHMQNPADLARELARVTKPDGWVVLTTVNNHCEQAQLLDYPEHLWEFTPEDLVGLFSPYGDARYRVVGNYHTLSCWRK